MSADIVPFDWGRMFLGDVPPLFLLEIVFRTTLMFLWLVVLLRIMGKRGLAQLSPLELAIVIGLGSAAGDPMFYPEVPLIHAMLVLALVVGLQRGLSYLVIRSERVETFIEGIPVELVRGGVIRLSALSGANLSREDLFERLRGQGVRQLGEVQRAYFEQDGNLTVFTHKENPPPGLQVVPPWDLQWPLILDVATPHRGVVACLGCGHTLEAAGPLPDCPACSDVGHGSEQFSSQQDRAQSQGWTPATLDPLAPDESSAVGGSKRGGVEKAVQAQSAGRS
ncbi:YetF domain-containing protein [Deinococcus oregonensis]|uniref:YetF domain-containing protein n=1 Tax=Deinococcus oregonensis TaxID=1805970 RepID=A0ABV6B1N2_9DEIO